MSQQYASLSLDLDNKWSYLKTHGDRGWESFPSYLDGVVPRFLELLDDLKLRITVFIVGQDAAIAGNQSSLAAIANAGHEIANHSFHHEPWLHLYSSEQIDEELTAAERAIGAATGAQPKGFRGPGYSQSPALYECLARRGYLYDASSLPTILGPLARAYYFFSARLTKDQRRQRKRLFGSWRDGFRLHGPHWWQINHRSGDASPTRRLLEIPVTTMPLLRIPIHFSYLLFLRQSSCATAWIYWRLALNLCQSCGVEPSLLLHPLDLLGGDDEPDLKFFPAMAMPGKVKRMFVRAVLADFSQRYIVLPLEKHAALLAERQDLPIREIASVSVSAPQVAGPPSLRPQPALFAEASRQ
jgi:hypothetical protein